MFLSFTPTPHIDTIPLNTYTHEKGLTEQENPSGFLNWARLAGFSTVGKPWLEPFGMNNENSVFFSVDIHPVQGS